MREISDRIALDARCSQSCKSSSQPAARLCLAVTLVPRLGSILGQNGQALLPACVPEGECIQSASATFGGPENREIAVEQHGILDARPGDQSSCTVEYDIEICGNAARRRAYGVKDDRRRMGKQLSIRNVLLSHNGLAWSPSEKGPPGAVGGEQSSGAWLA
jgi:hypothetical protein